MRKDDCKKRSDDSVVFLNDVDLETGEIVTPTQPQFKDECDMNRILEKYSPEQIEERRLAMQGMFGDYSDVLDYGQAKMLVNNCDAAFNSLPAKVRSRFDNDPEQLIEFMLDESNNEEAVQLGLKPKDVLASKETPKSEEKESES